MDNGNSIQHGAIALRIYVLSMYGVRSRGVELLSTSAEDVTYSIAVLGEIA